MRPTLPVETELLDAVWPNTFVEEANLAQNIFTLRKVLGDGEEGHSFIETVPKRGYRFVAPVQMDADSLPDSPRGLDGSTLYYVVPHLNGNGIRDYEIRVAGDGVPHALTDFGGRRTLIARRVSWSSDESLLVCRCW
jgi:hypothetical protein